MEMMGGKSIASQCRKVDIMSDAAYAVLTRRNATGNFYIDDEVLAQEGIKDMDQYAMEPGMCVCKSACVFACLFYSSQW